MQAAFSFHQRNENSFKFLFIKVSTKATSANIAHVVLNLLVVSKTSKMIERILVCDQFSQSLSQRVLEINTVMAE